MKKLPNVVIIVIDTLRKDYSMPLERILKKYNFRSYENAISPYPWTVPTHASLFTGLYPIQHNAHETKTIKMPDIKIRKFKKIMLNNILKDLGYYTYLFSANDFISPFFGFAPFHYVHKPIPRDVIPISSEKMKKLDNLKQYDRLTKAKILLNEGEIALIVQAMARNFFIKHKTPIKIYRKLTRNWPDDKGVSIFIKSLKKLSFNSPFFMFMNLMEMHEPYGLWDTLTWRDNITRENITPKRLKLWNKKYRKNIEYLTPKIEKIINIFQAKNLWENTLFIITSDHGQLLGEDGKIGHGIFLDDFLLRVPLFIKYPRQTQIYESQDLNKFIPLTKLKKITLEIINNPDKFDESSLFSSTAFAESYGLPFNIPKTVYNKNKEIVNKLDRYKIAIYHDNLKGVFDVSAWKFEKIINIEKNEILSDINNEQLKSLVIDFLSKNMIK